MQSATIRPSSVSQQTDINSSLTLQLLQQIQQNISYAMRAQNILGVNSAIEQNILLLGDALENHKNNTETMYQQLLENFTKLEDRTELLLNSSARSFVISSCAVLQALSPAPSSGYYWVLASNGSAVHVYCDMTRSCGGVTGGWMRVGYLDMTNSSLWWPWRSRLAPRPSLQFPVAYSAPLQ